MSDAVVMTVVSCVLVFLGYLIGHRNGVSITKERVGNFLSHRRIEGASNREANQYFFDKLTEIQEYVVSL